MEHHQFEDIIAYLWSKLDHLVNNEHIFSMQVLALLELNIKLKFDHYSMEHHQFEDVITYLRYKLAHLVNKEYSF
jgi:hypothetical protein